jgi:hypothetical protein
VAKTQKRNNNQRFYDLKVFANSFRQECSWQRERQGRLNGAKFDYILQGRTFIALSEVSNKNYLASRIK